MARSSLSRCPVLVLGILFALTSLPSMSVAAPRLSVSPLDPRYRDGEFIEVAVFLELDGGSESFDSIQFGIQGDPALEVHFFFSVPFLVEEEFQTFRHRIWDNQRIYAGTGSRGFLGQAPTIPVIDGKIELGILQMTGTRETTDPVETHILRLGTCQCFDDPAEDAAWVKLDFATQVDLQIVDLEVTLGEDVFVRGDANVDAEVDMSDALTVLTYLFLGGGIEATCLDALDYDDSGLIDMQDGISNLEFLFLGAPTPPSPPFPDRGPDPTTGDALNCVEYDTTQ
jgi:hypothetical protein